MRTPLGLVVVLALTVAACDDTPLAPTPPLGTPPAAFDLTPFVGTWTLTLRLRDVKGDDGCVLDTMRELKGVPSPYSLTVTPSAVTLTNPAGDYACTFNRFVTDGDGFTTRGVTGTFTCVKPTLVLRCADGTTHDLFSMGSDIEARLSDGTITGWWGADFYYDAMREVEITADFTGTR